MISKVLVALDHATTSRQVLDEAIALAKVTHAQLRLFHVITPRHPDYPTGLGTPDVHTIPVDVYQDVMQRYAHQKQTFEEQLWKRLRSLTDEATLAGISADCSQRFGSPGPLICKMAHRWGADLIIVGRRGLGTWSELILGSVSRYVICHASCPVMVVQSKAQQGQSDSSDSYEQNTVA
jgi:nucleotide-binding universal stress UspA family protein